MNDFSIHEAVKFGWEKVKANFWFAVGTSLVYAIFNIGFQLKGGREEGANAVPDIEITATLVAIMAGAILLGIAFGIVGTIVQIGYTRMYMRLHDGERRPFKELFTDFRPFWRYVGASILFGLRVLAGFILLIVPGFIWAVKFGFMPLIVVDKRMKPVEAMRESARITEGHKWHLFKLCLVIAALNILGLICLGVGFLVSFPVTTLAYIHVYRKLSGQASAEVPAEIPASPAPEVNQGATTA